MAEERDYNAIMAEAAAVLVQATAIRARFGPQSELWSTAHTREDLLKKRIKGCRDAFEILKYTTDTIADEFGIDLPPTPSIAHESESATVNPETARTRINQVRNTDDQD